MPSRTRRAGCRPQWLWTRCSLNQCTHCDAASSMCMSCWTTCRHKYESVRTRLADLKRARWHLHFTPTSASWLNVIEGWFSVLTSKALTNTSFTSTRQLEAAIDLWGSH
jgi:hypothetical protein